MTKPREGATDAELLEAARAELEARARRTLPKRPRAISELEADAQLEALRLHTRQREIRDRRVSKQRDHGRRLAALELVQLRALPRGPRLEPWQLHNPRTYVVEADLARLGPELFAEYRSELQARAAAVALTGTELAVLTVLAWCHGRKDTLDGAGFQGRKEELARIVGVDRSTVYRALARLRDRGLVKMFARKRRYRTLSHELRARWVDNIGRELPFSVWRDRKGRVRSHVDVHAVAYATRKGVALVHGAERGHRGELLPQGLWERLWKTLRDASRRIRMRFSTAPAPRARATPIEDSRVEKRSFWAPTRQKAGRGRVDRPPGDLARPPGAPPREPRASDAAARGLLGAGGVRAAVLEHQRRGRP